MYKDRYAELSLTSNNDSVYLKQIAELEKTIVLRLSKIEGAADAQYGPGGPYHHLDEKHLMFTPPGAPYTLSPKHRIDFNFTH